MQTEELRPGQELPEGPQTWPVGSPSDLAVDLPQTARSSGFSRVGTTISVDDQRVRVYVTRADGRTARWARLAAETGCA